MEITKNHYFNIVKSKYGDKYAYNSSPGSKIFISEGDHRSPVELVGDHIPVFRKEVREARDNNENNKTNDQIRVIIEVESNPCGNSNYEGVEIGPMIGDIAAGQPVLGPAQETFILKAYNGSIASIPSDV